MRNYFGLLGILAITAMACWILLPFLSAFIWAVVIFQAMRPVSRRLSGHVSRTMAAAAMVFIVALAGVVPVTLVGGQLAYEATVAVQSIQAKNLNKLSVASVQKKLESLPLPKGIRSIVNKYRVDEDALAAHASEAGQKLLQWLAIAAAGIARGAGSFIFSVIAFLFIFFFLCRDGTGWYRRISQAIPMEFDFDSLAARMAAGASAIFFGVAGTCLLQGIAGGIAFAVLGLPSPFLAGALIAICALVPAIGTALVWGPAAIWLMVSGAVTKGIILVVIGAGVIGMMDNVTRPLLARLGGSELSVLTITLGAIGGIAAFGLTGIIIGPLAIEAFSWLMEHLAANRGEPAAAEERAGQP
ncbi:hypothetical protein OR1_03025 [Geobacter sp. OR-1]|uniref:AI-2E family transporter n=1 Tax=Geobacter sp. OR-1 TaxID=1266765 RepID=UPI000542884D|nr:AI-2E family transporter [Geobacter sp. OR-1]GAM10732.1 hypothetical protein OR1_03025 [Geobacter sp. OR-1]